MSDVSAVLSLLDDPDPQVQAALLKQLMDDADLRDRAWAACHDEPPALLTEIVLRSDALDLLEAWSHVTALEEGWALLAHLHQPRRDHASICAQSLDALAARAPDGDAGSLARWLAEDVGFAGDREAYDDPRNSHLPEVLERRAGLPIAVTGVWLLLCRRLGRPARALAMPAHVFAAWDDGAWDCFTGKPVSSEQLELWAISHGAPSAEPFLAGADDRELLLRMARNLAAAYARHDQLVHSAIAALLTRGP
jgi:hypothetical protein